MTPLERLDDWDDFVAELYPEPVEAGGKRREDYRDFDEPPRDTVRESYRLNHGSQTWSFVQHKKAEYLTLDRAELPVWEALEYLYQVLRDYLPEPALYMIRYHSFYACHREGAYGELLCDRDREMFAWVRLFNNYDLYSKSDSPPNAAELRPCYQGLIDRYLPAKLNL